MQKAAGLRHTDRLVHSVCDGAAWPVGSSSTLFFCLVWCTTLDRIPWTRWAVGRLACECGSVSGLSAAAPTGREHVGQQAVRVDESQHVVKRSRACRRAAVPVQEHWLSVSGCSLTVQRAGEVKEMPELVRQHRSVKICTDNVRLQFPGFISCLLCTRADWRFRPSSAMQAACVTGNLKLRRF